MVQAKLVQETTKTIKPYVRKLKAYVIELTTAQGLQDQWWGEDRWAPAQPTPSAAVLFAAFRYY
jgi:hypothetical protein